MDSSAKYQKFGGSKGDKEKKPQESKKEYKRLTIVLLLVTIISTTISCFISGVAVGIRFSLFREPGQSANKNGLRVNVITSEELQGEYYSSAESIHFESTVNSSYVSLFIATTSGEPVVHVLHPVNSSITMMCVKNASFLVMENQPGSQKYVDFVIPNNRMNLMQSMIMGQRNMTEEDLQQLDNETVNETRQFSLGNLALSQEALLIIEAAEAFDNRGIQGTEYPCVTSIYLLALTLAKAREMRESNFTLDSTERIQNRQLHYSGNVSSVCQRYPYPFNGNRCFGLCGLRCQCWSFVCGDCCVHQFCHTHDMCCFEHGYRSWACWSVMWDFTSGSLMCEQNYTCPH